MFRHDGDLERWRCAINLVKEGRIDSVEVQSFTEGNALFTINGVSNMALNLRRPTWDATWLSVADVIANRSLCTRRKAGCVLVSAENRIAGTGYNGPPAGFRVTNADAGLYGASLSTPCATWCERARTGGTTNNYDDCPSIHSEANALMHSNRKDREGGTAYVTSCPCLTCAKNLANSGLHRVVYRISEADAVRAPEKTKALLTASGLQVVIAL